MEALEKEQMSFNLELDRQIQTKNFRTGRGNVTCKLFNFMS